MKGNRKGKNEKWKIGGKECVNGTRRERERETLTAREGEREKEIRYVGGKQRKKEVEREIKG